MGTSLSRLVGYCQPRSEDWVRPLVEVEKFYAKSSEQGTYNLAFTLVLTTKQQLPEAVVKDAVLQLYRTAPSLQVCIDDRRGSPWFRRLKQDDLTNLTFLEEPTLELAMKHHEKMVNQTYSKKGPTWHLTVVSVPCPILGQEQTFGYVFVFGFHHAITDGVSNYTLAGYLLSLLEEATERGRVQASPKPPFSFSPSMQTLLLMGWELLKLLVNPWAKERALREIGGIVQSKPDLLVRSPADPGQRTSRAAVRQLDEALTSKFVRLCKQEGVTVHTGFCTLLNLACVSVMSEAGLQESEPEGFNIRSLHSINLRRYWRGDASSALGPHVSVYLLEHRLSSSSLAREKFWDLAAQLHKISQKKIATKDTFRQTVAFFMFEKKYPQSLGAGKIPVIHYVTSNMGNVDKYFPPSVIGDSPESCLQLVEVVQSSSMNSCPSLLGLSFHTLRGRLSYSISYHSELVTDKMAHDMLGTIEDLTIKILECSSSDG